jgi:hypothetical protein
MINAYCSTKLYKELEYAIENPEIDYYRVYVDAYRTHDWRDISLYKDFECASEALSYIADFCAEHKEYSFFDIAVFPKRLFSPPLLYADNLAKEEAKDPDKVYFLIESAINEINKGHYQAAFDNLMHAAIFEDFAIAAIAAKDLIPYIYESRTTLDNVTLLLGIILEYLQSKEVNHASKGSSWSPPPRGSMD